LAADFGFERQAMKVSRIISGGQTGVDRAALDAALELGVPCGGWCPRGRRAEDGRIPDHYPLKETSTKDYRVRTARNIMESDGTLILARGPLKGGTALTWKLAEEFQKPCLVIDLGKRPDAAKVRSWAAANRIDTLNVAGPREEEARGIHDLAVFFLKAVLAP
jgi:predicted Rossmann-fold nucleotide-binding protein